MNRLAKSLLVLFGLLVAVGASAELNSREYLRNQITDWGKCRTVAITRTNGDAGIYGDNGYTYKDIPKEMASTIIKLHNQKARIEDLWLTNDGNWVIVYNEHSASWSGITAEMEDALYEVYNERENIHSASFNDDGKWLIITDTNIMASDKNLLDWVLAGTKKYGAVLTGCITEDAVFVVYAKGYKYYGTISDMLLSELQTTPIDVYQVKVSGQSWFFADRKGHYKFRM